MPVFSKIASFVNKHRTKFFVGGVVLTGSFLATRYAHYRLREWQQNEAKEFYERTRKQQHFESTECVCNKTILSLTPALTEALNNAFDVEEVIAELRNNPENKVELWNRLKMLVFGKVSSLIYVAVLLVVTLRIQLNILGGYLYKDPASVSQEAQQKYLSLCNSLLNTGIAKLSQVLMNEYKNVLDVIPLNKQLKLTDLEKIFWAVQVALKEKEEDPIRNLKGYVITDQEVLTDIMTDTADLLQSEEIISITNSCINRSFAIVGDQIAEFYGPSTSNEHFVSPSELKIPLAKLIPIINGLTIKNTLLGTLIEQLLINDKLKALGANVYEAFSFSK